ncbi:Uncharacterised protein [Afipia felis]|uniref:Uncharacterized protein n=2 Tax=Afipia felis TaxID=1035 RepID=A0A380WCJ5_AFIFE|nr:hypothetical protein HMPREF9697_01601 [Afipia felis ATCC 53690]SUU77780.1 Uncharacterised protein [Afipia felis]SUU85845.1 Uncharacterised protein [Afipia felis]
MENVRATGSGRFGEGSFFNGISVVRHSSGMRATGAAGFGAGPESFVHDLADGAGTTATLGAATEAPIDLPCRPGRLLCVSDDTANIVVAQHIAGTDDHQHQHLAVREALSDMSSSLTGCKSKTPSFKLFQTGPFPGSVSTRIPPSRPVPQELDANRSTIMDECYGKTA